MPNRPPQHRPTGFKPRTPWQKSAFEPQRVRGRTNQKRKQRIHTRDGWTCKACGRMTVQLQVDHIVPLSRGGRDDDDANLQSLCIPCHEAKSKRERST